MDIVDYEVIKGIFSHDVSILDCEKHILFTLCINQEESIMCCDCRENLIREELGKNIKRAKCVSNNHWARLCSAFIAENVPGLVGIRANVGYAYMIELDTKKGPGFFYLDTINDKRLNIDHLEKIIHNIYSELKDKDDTDEIINSIITVIREYDEDDNLVECGWFYNDN